VRIIARRSLREFWEQHPDAEQPLRAWYHDAWKADWRSPADIKRVYANASIVGENRVVFNIKGNKYRLVVAINYPYRTSYIRFIGSRAASTGLMLRVFEDSVCRSSQSRRRLTTERR
jgi:mRNA interferase HigB